MISRRIFLLFLYYVVLEGAFRKWVAPELSNELFVMKDALLAAAVGALYLIDRRRFAATGPLQFRPGEVTMWQMWIVITVVAFVATGFSITGFIGLRYYLVPLLVLLAYPLLASDLEGLRQFMRPYLVLSVLICLLGLFQFTSSPDSLINRYSWAPNSDIDVATFGEAADRLRGFSYVRITGTFSYISPYAVYLQFVYFCAIAMFLTSTSERERVWYLAATIAILANLFMTGSRGPVLGCLLLSAIFAPSLKRALGGKFGFVGVFTSVIAVVASIWLLADVGQALIERNAAAGDAQGRVGGLLFSPWYSIISSDFWGDGLGSTFLGLGQLTGAGGFEYTFDEVTQDRLAVETGVLGYSFFLFFKLYFTIATARLATRSSNFGIKVWALVSLSYQISLAWTVPLYNSVAATFYFFSIALFIWLRRLNSASNEKLIMRGAMRPDLVPEGRPAARPRT